MTTPLARQRIDDAKRAGTRERLVGEGIQRVMAEAWVASWEGGIADMHDLRLAPEFWEQGYGFAIREWRAGHKPPPPPDTSSDERGPAP